VWCISTICHFGIVKLFMGSAKNIYNTYVQVTHVYFLDVSAVGRKSTGGRWVRTTRILHDNDEHDTPILFYILTRYCEERTL